MVSASYFTLFRCGSIIVVTRKNYSELNNRCLYLGRKKKHLNYNKLEILQNCLNHKFLPNCFLFLPFGRCYLILTWYLQSTGVVCIIIGYCILIGFKDKNCKTNLTNFPKRLQKNLILFSSADLVKLYEEKKHLEADMVN